MNDPTLTPQLMLHAYASGIFPMAESRTDPEIFWVDPDTRGVMPLNGFHISRSLRKVILSDRFEPRFNTDFEGVVTGCADREETWINQTIFALYRELHQMRHAFSQEVYLDGTLVGGVYGVTLGAAFFGESMFSTEGNASKVAMAYLVDRLRLTRFKLFDTQFITPHLTRMGAKEIERQTYQRLLADALSHPADILALEGTQTPYEVVQRNTQMS